MHEAVFDSPNLKYHYKVENYDYYLIPYISIYRYAIDPSSILVVVRCSLRYWFPAGAKSACVPSYLDTRCSPAVVGGYRGGLFSSVHDSKHSTTVSKVGSKKNGME